jgi:hypothetical protein
MIEQHHPSEPTFERALRPTEFEVRLLTRVAMLDLVEHLVREFSEVHSAGHVIRQMYRTREMLLAQGVRSGLVPATEAATRRQLLGAPAPVRSAPARAHESPRTGSDIDPYSTIAPQSA